jgi:hypothetical protein
MRKVDEVLPRVQDCRFSNGEGVIMFRNCGRIVRGVGKYPPDADALLDEFTIQTRDFGDVAVGDRTIAGSKDKYHETNSRSGEFLDRGPVKVQSVGLTGMD